jgi:polyphenol oxidase
VSAEALPAPLPLLRPDWPGCADSGPVGAAFSTRLGGVSAAPFNGLNLRPAGLVGMGETVADAPEAIAENQRRYAQALGATPVWLQQVHGTAVVRLTRADGVQAAASAPLPVADAAISTEPGVACTVLVADCLPVLFSGRNGRVVGAAHAGWRGLAAGVLERTVAAMTEAGGCAPQELRAWLGPCIGPTAFEVGEDVLKAFGVSPASADPARFSLQRHTGASGSPPKWFANLPQLARDRLRGAGLTEVGGGGLCTFGDASRFFSFRRDGGATGRLAASVWLRG